MKRTASCACGQLRITCAAEPLRISACYCHACQKRTGSAFGVQARFALEDVAIEGDPSTYERVGDAGGRVTFAFCGRCGTTLCWAIDKMPGQVAVAVGCFADQDFPQPTVTVYETRRHPWAKIEGKEPIDRHG